MKIIDEIDGKGRSTEAGAGQNSPLFTVLAKPHFVVTFFLCLQFRPFLEENLV